MQVLDIWGFPLAPPHLLLSPHFEKKNLKNLLFVNQDGELLDKEC